MATAGLKKPFISKINIFQKNKLKRGDLNMDDKPTKVSPETQKFLDDLKKRYPHANPRPYVPEKSISERIEEWALEAPSFVISLCKVLFKILCFIKFPFVIVGGIFSLIWAYGIWKDFSASGWESLLSMNTLYIIIYFAIIFITNKILLFLYKITE